MGATSEKQTIHIHIGILAEEPLGWGSGKHYFPVILDGYQWRVKGTTYLFSTEYLYDKDIRNGKLTTENFHAVLVPGGGVGDGHSIMKGFSSIPHVRSWKKQISAFIKQGGGYIGICGGTALLTGLTTGKHTKPTTFTERQYEKSSLGVSSVQSYYNHLAIPLFFPFQKYYPERIGATAYVFSFAPGTTTDGVWMYSGGVPVDFQINCDHPIFAGMKRSTEKIRWWGGPALEVPSTADRDISILARYPAKDFSTQDGTRIYAWKYTGGLRGLLKGLFKSFQYCKHHHQSLRHLLTFAYFLAGDWVQTDRLIDLEFSNKASITAEVYPNEHQGRILLCTAHPEYMVWWDGSISEVDSHGFHCLATGFHQWNKIRPFQSTGIEELMYTWWMVRRFAAWAAKVPDDHLPPIERGEITHKATDLLAEVFPKGDIIDQMKSI